MKAFATRIGRLMVHDRAMWFYVIPMVIIIIVLMNYCSWNNPLA